MDNLIYFSVAKLIPNVERNESINFGFSYFIPQTNEIGFIPSKNKKRILSFDDETTVEEIEFLQNSLKYDFSLESLTFMEDEDVEKYFTSPKPSLLIDKIYNYANIIQFDTIKTLFIEKDLKHTLEDIKNFYLYYDQSINQRQNTKARLFSMANNTVKAYIDKENFTKIKNDASTFFYKPFDFEVILNSQINYIKVIKFDYIQPGDLYKELKALNMDLIMYNKENPNPLSNNNFHLVINPTNFSKEHEKISYELMKEYANIITLDKLPELLTKDKIV